MATFTDSRRARALAALMTSATVKSAAALSGVGERTLHRWLRDPEFAAQLAEVEAELVDGAARRLLSLTEDAIRSLAQLSVGAEDDGIRLRTAVAILDQAARWRESVSIEKRVVALEQGVQDGKTIDKTDR
ncbi:MAG: hypothetical protein KGR21_09315 [Proteobacteria bacterium]|nr:hypothetical protein [Pseudomonadota bacterium]